MDGRTSKQCRERWCHHLDPAVRKGGYTTEEDDLIILLQVRGDRRSCGASSFFVAGVLKHVPRKVGEVSSGANLMKRTRVELAFHQLCRSSTLLGVERMYYPTRKHARMHTTFSC